MELAGTSFVCPRCEQVTLLSASLAEELLPSAEPASGVHTIGQLVAAFQGSVKRTVTSPFYLLGLTLVSAVMLLLPLLYLLMIAGAAWGVSLWARHFSFLIRGMPGGIYLGLLKAFLYLGPLVAGVVLVFFMIKPLLAPRQRQAHPLALNASAEPLLFCFVDALCRTMGAPAPKRIDVNCQLNASASFRRGLRSLLSNELVLTIGLPLVAGLSLQQFAGVLAHEFGHFTQGTGMRLSYLIRRVNGWFARVVFERDAWDQAFDEWANETRDYRMLFVVLCARVAVGLSRGLLWVLMLLGHGVSCYLLRQMEYDADRYQIRLAGSEAFETSARRIHVLGAVLQVSYQEMRAAWNQSRRLPDNLPAELLRSDGRLSLEARTRLEDTMGLGQTGWFDTHPSAGDRIRQARRAEEPGVLHLDAPASSLFGNFEVLARQVTQLHYTDDLGLAVLPASFVPVPRLASDDASKRL